MVKLREIRGFNRPAHDLSQIHPSNRNKHGNQHRIDNKKWNNEPNPSGSHKNRY